jgi:hypothetical protein
VADSKKLTYAGALGALRAGGSVLWKDPAGQIYHISRVEDLPSEAAWAAGNPEAEAAARRALDEQIARLLAQRDALPTATPPDAAEETGPAPSAPSTRPAKPAKPPATGEPAPPPAAPGEGAPPAAKDPE